MNSPPIKNLFDFDFYTFLYVLVLALGFHSLDFFTICWKFALMATNLTHDENKYFFFLRKKMTFLSVSVIHFFIETNQQNKQKEILLENATSIRI